MPSSNSNEYRSVIIGFFYIIKGFKEIDNRLSNDFCGFLFFPFFFIAPHFSEKCWDAHVWPMMRNLKAHVMIQLHFLGVLMNKAKQCTHMMW